MNAFVLRRQHFRYPNADIRIQEKIHAARSFSKSTAAITCSASMTNHSATNAASSSLAKNESRSMDVAMPSSFDDRLAKSNLRIDDDPVGDVPSDGLLGAPIVINILEERHDDFIKVRLICDSFDDAGTLCVIQPPRENLLVSDVDRPPTERVVSVFLAKMLVDLAQVRGAEHPHPSVRVC